MYIMLTAIDDVSFLETKVWQALYIQLRELLVTFCDIKTWTGKSGIITISIGQLSVSVGTIYTLPIKKLDID